MNPLEELPLSAKRLPTLLLAFLTFTVVALAQTVPELLVEADAKFQAGQQTEARALYEAIVEREPGTVQAWVRLGLLYSWENRLTESLSAYEKALSLAEGDVDLRLDIARIRSWEGDLKLSIENYRQIIADHPSRLDARLALAQVLAWDNQFDSSIETYDAILQLDPGNLKARLGKAQTYSWSERTELAETQYREILKDNPKQEDAWLALARVVSWQDRLPEAISIYEEFLKEYPENASAHTGLGQVHSWQGMDKKAYASTRRALALDPSDRDAKKLKRNLDLRHRPSFDPYYLGSRDSDGNQLQVVGGDFSFDLDPQVRASIGYRNQSASYGNPVSDGQATAVTASLNARLSPEVALSGTFGQISLDPRSAGYIRREPIGSLGLALTPTSKDSFNLGFQREALADTSQLIANDITAKTVSINYRRRLPGDNNIALGYSNTEFSDQNRRDVVFASAWHDFRRWGPNIALGVTHRALTFDHRTFSGYFAPPTFKTTEAFFRVDNHETDNPWLYSLELAGGQQKIDKEGSQFVHRIGASLGYRFTDNVELELSGLTSNSAISTVSGFRYSNAGARMKIRF